MRALIVVASCVAACAGSKPGDTSTHAAPTPSLEPEPDPPKSDTPLANEGEACGGVRKIACAPGLSCREDDTPLPPLSDAGLPRESGPGGACGGIAGFHCQEGLVCTMTEEQEHVADGMGECGRKATCVKAAQ